MKELHNNYYTKLIDIDCSENERGGGEMKEEETMGRENQKV